MERETRFELATATLARWCSTGLSYSRSLNSFNLGLFRSEDSHRAQRYERRAPHGSPSKARASYETIFQSVNPDFRLTQASIESVQALLSLDVGSARA